MSGEVAYLEIDTALIGWATMLGLCEYRDDCWQMTEKGSKVVLDYCAKRRGELGK